MKALCDKAIICFCIWTAPSFANSRTMLVFQHFLTKITNRYSFVSPRKETKPSETQRGEECLVLIDLTKCVSFTWHHHLRGISIYIHDILTLQIQTNRLFLGIAVSIQAGHLSFGACGQNDISQWQPYAKHMVLPHGCSWSRNKTIQESF